MVNLKNKLKSKFLEKEYAHSYMESHAVTKLAAQVNALRKQRSLSQEDLAEISGIAQTRISKIESADFDSLTMKTLNKLARAFDVNLQISFGKFSDGIQSVAEITPKNLEVPSRVEDLSTSVFDADIGNPSNVLKFKKVSARACQISTFDIADFPNNDVIYTTGFPNAA